VSQEKQHDPRPPIPKGSCQARTRARSLLFPDYRTSLVVLSRVIRGGMARVVLASSGRRGLWVRLDRFDGGSHAAVIFVPPNCSKRGLGELACGH
jgi:hypothetical protein